MAITIAQKPYTLTPLNQRLVFRCTSTQVAQPGFRFVFDVEVSGDTHRILIVPNAANNGIFDIHHLLRPYIKQSMSIASPNVHRLLGYTQIDTGGDIETVVVTVYDGYDIAGVFTVVDGPTDGVVSTHYIWNGYLSDLYGYRPNPEEHYDVSRNPLTGLRQSGLIYFWDQAIENGFDFSQMCVPVNYTDWGVISFIVDDGTYFSTNPAAWKIRQVVQNPGDVPITVTETLVLGSDPQILIVGAYPANVNADGGLTWQQPDADFLWMSWEILDGSDNPVSTKIIMYNNYHISGEGCRYNNIRVAWSNVYGGWDYFNFTLKNEISHDIDRKRFRKLSGTYNAASFTSPAHDRGHTEFDVNVDSFLEVTSDWITEAAFEFLRGLFISKDVYLIDPVLGTITPNADIAVVVEDSSYRERAERNSKKYNQTIKLKFSLPAFVP